MDVNFCEDHRDKTEVSDPLAVEDLISYKLNNKRKLARLITQYIGLHDIFQYFGRHVLPSSGCDRETPFSNSLIIHQVKTKEITTVKEVWIPGLN